MSFIVAKSFFCCALNVSTAYFSRSSLVPLQRLKAATFNIREAMMRLRFFSGIPRY